MIEKASLINTLFGKNKLLWIVLKVFMLTYVIGLIEIIFFESNTLSQGGNFLSSVSNLKLFLVKKGKGTQDSLTENVLARIELIHIVKCKTRKRGPILKV